MSSGSNTTDDERFMEYALAEARLALESGEVPIGAIVVINDEIIGRGHNSVIASSDPTAHGEILAIRAAAARIGNYRLTGSTLYSTIEPCTMCAGTLVHARVARLVYGAPDPRAGAVDTHFGICRAEALNHQVSVTSGILESRCREMIQSFFREKRDLGEPERCESG